MSVSLVDLTVAPCSDEQPTELYPVPVEAVVTSGQAT
jgi:hypothetical protein